MKSRILSDRVQQAVAVLLFGLVWTSARADEANAPNACPDVSSQAARELIQQDTKIYRGNAVVGVDALGRVAIAMDVGTKEKAVDGVADHYFLFTAKERLRDGPWGQIHENVTLIDTGGNLTLASANRDFGVALTVAEFRHKRSQETVARTIEVRDGLEIARQVGDDTRLTDITHYDVSTWPASFEGDLLGP